VERLANPSVKHQLLSIALNSVAKYRVRVLPSLLQYRAARGHLPPALTFSLAALLAFYRGTEIREGALCGSRASKAYPARDDREVLAAFTDAWQAFGAHGNADILCRTILARTDFWGEDLSVIPDLLERVTAHLTRIVREGIRPALRALG
jgi:tagaturonate reductase